MKQDYILILNGSEESTLVKLSLEPIELNLLVDIKNKVNEAAPDYAPTMQIKPLTGCHYCRVFRPDSNYCKECGRKLT